MQDTITGIAWYRRQDYQRLKQMFTDGEKLPDTYGQWLVSAQRIYDTLKLSGQTVEKVLIDPEEFPKWCKANKQKLDTLGRTTYAGESARARHKS